jgi:hypothetical protein
MTAYLEAIKAAAPSFGISLTLADVRDATDIERSRRLGLSRSWTLALSGQLANHSALRHMQMCEVSV